MVVLSKAIAALGHSVPQLPQGLVLRRLCIPGGSPRLCPSGRAAGTLAFFASFPSVRASRGAKTQQLELPRRQNFFFFTDFTSRPIETYFPRIKRTVYRHACSGYSVQKYRILSIFDEEYISRGGPLTEGLGNGNPLLRGRNYGSLTYRTYTPRNEVWAKERNDKTQRPPKDDGHRNPWEMARKYLLSHVGIPTLALLDCGGEGTHVENHILFVVSLHFSSAPRKKGGGGGTPVSISHGVQNQWIGPKHCGALWHSSVERRSATSQD